MSTTTTVSVMQHSTGERLGEVEIGERDAALYAAGEHPGYQWPEGVAEAGDVMTDEQIDEMGVTAGTVICLDV